VNERKFICPFCNRKTEKIKREKERIVIYECSSCGSLVAAYLKEYHDILVRFFNRYNTERFKPVPPLWVKSGGQK